MATSYKTIDPTTDTAITRTLLHEAIPLTGSIISGTYADLNIENFDLFQSIYDYPFLSSSANHIFDITVGYAASSSLSNSLNPQNTQKIQMYNSLAQVLAGNNETGAIRLFDRDGDLTGGAKIGEAYFINFTRLLSKDEIKKGSFTLTLGLSQSFGDPFGGPTKYTVDVVDKSGSNGYKINSPAGEYGILYATGSALDATLVDGTGYLPAGLLYYQAGIAVLNADIFSASLTLPCSMSFAPAGPRPWQYVMSGSQITASADSLRHRIQNISFNNTTELNSTIYFCRVHHNDFNYSSNPTYLSQSKIRVKTSEDDEPVSYVTSCGMFSPSNELLAVAKLGGGPLKKTPSTEFTLRVRLDY